MGLSDSTALVALVVSLVALCIASLQLLQSIFSTAEGFKRCAKSVIGPWEGLRRRRFHWREFRFEVMYITPQILLLSEDTKSLLEEEHREAQPDTNHKEHVHILHRDLIKEKFSLARTEIDRWKANTAWWRRHCDPWNYHNKIRVLEETIFHREGRLRDPPQRLRNWVDLIARFRAMLYTKGSPSQTPATNDNFESQTQPTFRRSAPMSTGLVHNNMVSWGTLAKELYNMYSDDRQLSAVSASSVDRQVPIEPKIPYGLRYIAHQLLFPDREAYRSFNFARTDASIAFREYSWDTMPSDMMSPLATIVIGHLTVLAVRLGMQWRLLNLENGMSADGNGYSLSCTKSDKLGLVFRLITVTSQHDKTKLIPSKATDKLICGKLPGCPILVRKDFDIVDDKRQSQLDLGRALEQSHILYKLGVPKVARTELSQATANQREFTSIQNEIVPLLCTFLPLHSSDAVYHYAHCWTEKRKSILQLWEGRYTLLRRLEKLIHNQGTASVDEGLAMTFKYLERLKVDFPRDFFGLKDGKAIDKQSEERTALLSLCREIHRWTDQRLKIFRMDEEDFQARLHYENLVAAHINMATHATVAMYDKFPNNDLPSCSIEDTAKIPARCHTVLDGFQGVDPTNRPSWIVCRLVETANRYVDDMDKEEHSVAKYLQERGLKCTTTDIRTAWWMLMLRGVVWNMSTLDSAWGEPIPASFYDNHVPVWIT